jgi:anti-sigma factor RsiW
MNRETALLIQADADGELSPRKHRQVAALLDTDPAARSLHAQLQGLKRLLKENEPQHAVPEAREFYWSKIARGIEREAATAARPRRWDWLPVWVRWVAPAGALAAVLALFVLGRSQPYSPFQASSLDHLDEEEAYYFPTSTITFRSEAQEMTVLWVQNRWD